MVSSASSNNTSKRAMQLTTNPALAIAASPALHKDHWQQRRYDFLSRNSMFSGELRDDVNESEQRSASGTPKLRATDSVDSDDTNVRHDSILNRAMTGVRNFLAEDDEDELDNRTNISLKNIVLTKTETDESVRSDDNEQENRHSSASRAETDVTLPSTPKKKTLKSRWLSRIFRHSKSSHQTKQLYHSHRPYFTYWVTFVQIIVCITSLLVYGHAPLSRQSNTKSHVEQEQHVDLTTNPWFGPYPADLIRLGAKYSPCIRRHDEVKNRYERQIRLENISGCCIDSATGRCMQTLPQQCLPRAGLTWYRTPVKNESDFVYPAVCGLTPETCTKQLIGNVPRLDDSSWASTIVDTHVFKWSPYAVQWPICLEQDYNRIANNLSLYPHMQCTNIAKPCCTGVHGDCVLTSKDDCRRRRGIYHPRAHLCSQVDCIQSVCGMLEFFVARVPDQVYRFWTVIFIHAGLIHLLITIIFQYTIMRPLEKLAGCIRVMIIYIVSGFVGNLASALILRDSIQVGPGGGQLAVLACYLSELYLGWRSLKRPWIPFFKIIICLGLLLTVGLFPLVDNYSQCFGFLIGFMLNMIVFPDVNFRTNVRRLVVVTTALSLTIALFVTLIVLFYTVPFKCVSCQVFTCPFGNLCDK